ncbi:MAG: membrane protein insertase YidC [Mogibacterium sp.]|jgi:YidC/Oxa1 family membrane protein insertase|nr:membrane protein insertase YidC [Clostridiales bacterium]MBR3376559.1 membrane protein insertase YidC [Mogibacterium sp.]MCQ2563612.1 YidC/Oxa1 family membrane protein insertase [Mogibacterium sp.]
MGIVAKPIGYLLALIYKLVGNYGISLIILTVIVKLALYPLYAKQIRSTADMSDMSEKAKEIQNRYANDKEKMNEEMQKLYAETGFNPMSGCLPMLIQFPIIMGLFALLRNPMKYMPSDPALMFANHESFLWIKDLAQPDLIILPIAAGLATFFAFSMNSAMTMQQPGANPGQQKAMNAIMKYFFPLSILWLARSYPAGLAIYWAGGQFMQIFFNLRINKIREEMKVEKEKKKLLERAEKELARKKRARMKGSY